MVAWRGRAALWVTRHIPQGVLAEPERSALNGAFIILGCLVWLPEVGLGVVRSWPDWTAFTWASLMVLGGLGNLNSIVTKSVLTERAGCVALMIGCTMYASGLLINLGLRGVPIAVIFYILAAAKALRLLRSTAFFASLRKHLDDGDLEQP